MGDPLPFSPLNSYENDHTRLKKGGGCTAPLLNISLQTDLRTDCAYVVRCIHRIIRIGVIPRTPTAASQRRDIQWRVVGSLRKDAVGIESQRLVTDDDPIGVRVPFNIRLEPERRGEFLIC